MCECDSHRVNTFHWIHFVWSSGTTCGHGKDTKHEKRGTLDSCAFPHSTSIKTVPTMQWLCISGAEELSSHFLTNEVSTSKHTHTHAQTWHTIAAAAATRVQHESSHLPTVIALGCASVLRAVEVHLQGTVHPIQMCQIPAVHLRDPSLFFLSSATAKRLF